MAKKLPDSHADLMAALVDERWDMLTMDTEVDSRTGVGSAIGSEAYDRLTGQLAWMASRLAGDGFEGEPETQEIVNDLMETIGARLCEWATHHRLAAQPLAVAS